MDMFTIVPIFIVTIAVIMAISIFVRAGRGIAEWADNNSKPVLSVPARVVTKRAETRTSGQDGQTSSSTSYYCTYELKNGDRLEFDLGAKEYGMLADGDSGTLTYQGTRYHGFKRRQ